MAATVFYVGLWFREFHAYVTHEINHKLFFGNAQHVFLSFIGTPSIPVEFLIKMSLFILQLITMGVFHFDSRGAGLRWPLWTPPSCENGLSQSTYQNHFFGLELNYNRPIHRLLHVHTQQYNLLLLYLEEEQGGHNVSVGLRETVRLGGSKHVMASTILSPPCYSIELSPYLTSTEVWHDHLCYNEGFTSSD